VARLDRLKRSLGTAIKRRVPSRAAQVLVTRELVRGRVLDFGCGFGLDADTFGWDSYDPAYRPREPVGPYDTIVCTLVLYVLSRNNRAKALERIQGLLSSDGRAYLTVARTSPKPASWGSSTAFRATSNSRFQSFMKTRICSCTSYGRKTESRTEPGTMSAGATGAAMPENIHSCAAQAR
jgi:hypothetical protein